MCGIAGIIALNKNTVSVERLKKMTDTIAHRGPDGEGQWVSQDGHVGLGHRRLSIIDLSTDANQPMHYLGRYSIVFNGEIYNYIELRDTLIAQGYRFRTQSDTEVLMALYDKHKEKCLHLLDGMFAFAIYDAKEQELFIARDRFGEKPLFYHYKPGECFYFASEMKALWAIGVSKEVNGRMLFNYLSYNYLENPHDASETFFSNCHRMPQSHYVKINVQIIQKKAIEKYYDINWEYQDDSIKLNQAKATFEELLYTSVKRRLRSDVAVGSSLSGGLDSSLLVCIIDKIKSSNSQNTFSATFPGFAKDERKFMDYVIQRTSVVPHFTNPVGENFVDNFEKLNWHQEEPYGSASIYAQFEVMKLAKDNNVTVLIDGQGADEILAGYHPYFVAYFRELRKNNKIAYGSELKFYEELHKNNTVNQKINKGLEGIIRNKLVNYIPNLLQLRMTFKQAIDPIFEVDFYNTYKDECFERTYNFKSLNHSLYESCMKFGLHELLRYADRNSMAHSREVRLPFLFHELVDFLFLMPSNLKIHKGWTKWIMRETFQELLPKEIAWRTDKIGYEPPQKKWMENKVINNKIVSSKEMLSQKKILNERFAKSPTKTAAANTRFGDWVYLMAGQL
jgi:asparagine synthase (glutamine-hydrolysing)